VKGFISLYRSLYVFLLRISIVDFYWSMKEMKFEVIFLEGGFKRNHLLFQKGGNVSCYNMCVFVELISEMVGAGMCL
jgi:hypothetical protein